MTGFGRAAGSIGERFSATVTARSVNHKYLEVTVRLPEWLWEMDSALRGIAGEFLSRGKVDITVRVQRVSEPEYSVRINRKVADAVLPQLRNLADEFAIDSTFRSGDLLRIPDLLSVEPVDADLEDKERDDLKNVVREAVGSLARMREVEGESLKTDVLDRIATVARLRDEVEAKRPDIIRDLLESYRQRVQEIASAAGATIDQDRLAQETVLMVERGDVAEELTRLRSHLTQVQKVIASEEAAGKKLDFLSQEILREINTLGQKSRSAELRTVVVELKTEVERIREQVQNVE
jgi:uncharacterized protein (TIGR00255 family)